MKAKDWIKIAISIIMGLVQLIREWRRTTPKNEKCEKDLKNVTQKIKEKIRMEREDAKDAPVESKKVIYTLKRTYFHEGTNGKLYLNDKVYNTIELPWRDNLQRISCIPEGVYKLQKRHSPRFDQHLHLPDVEGREWILIHPANHALDELAGCIAIVTEHTGPGMGIRSAIPTTEFRLHVYDLIDNDHDVYLKIEKEN